MNAIPVDKTYEEIAAASADRPPFANGGEYERWAFRWCNRCMRADRGGCVITDVAVVEQRTPAEWKQEGWGGASDYTCSEFMQIGTFRASTKDEQQ